MRIDLDPGRSTLRRLVGRSNCRHGSLKTNHGPPPKAVRRLLVADILENGSLDLPDYILKET